MQYHVSVGLRADTDATSSSATTLLINRLHQRQITSEIIPCPEKLDFGTTISIILGSAAIIELAKGISDVLRRYRSTTIIIERDGRRVEISNTNIGAHDIDKIKGFIEDALA